MVLHDFLVPLVDGGLEEGFLKGFMMRMGSLWGVECKRKIMENGEIYGVEW